MVIWLSVCFQCMLGAAWGLSPTPTAAAAYEVVPERPPANALAELRQAVGAVAIVAPAKGSAAAFQQASFSQINAQVTQSSAGVHIGVDDKQLLVLRNVSSKQDETGGINWSG